MEINIYLCLDGDKVQRQHVGAWVGENALAVTRTWITKWTDHNHGRGWGGVRQAGVGGMRAGGGWGAGGEGGVHSHPLKKLSSGTSTQCNTLSASVCVCVGVGVCVRGVR